MKPFTEHSFQTFLSENKLMAAKCENCGSLFVPPRPLCPKCHGEQMVWVELSGKGELAAFTAVYIGSTAMIKAGFNRKNPYLSGVVKLVEGPLISAQILGLDADQPEKINIGTSLTVAFIERGEAEEKRTFLAFQR